MVAANGPGAASPVFVPAAATGSSSFYDSARMFVSGGTAGAIARTCTAPLDRIKLLFQVQAMASAGTGSKAYTSVPQAFAKIYKEEGVLAFWKGNGTNIVRIFPYSAAQLAANDTYKRMLADPDGNLTVQRRLVGGACAGMTATALTHPLDTVRLRLALPNNQFKGLGHALRTIVAQEGVKALFKGLAPTLVGIAPYAAMNFASYDLLKHEVYGVLGKPQNAVNNLLIGACSGTFAATVCYPLDTIRRRMQMPGNEYANQLDAFKKIFAKEGMVGFYRGWVANTVKVVPQNSIRFVSYEIIKGLVGIKKKKTDT